MVQTYRLSCRFSALAFFAAFGLAVFSVSLKAEEYQYKFEQITIPKASAEEPKRTDVSVNWLKSTLKMVLWRGAEKENAFAVIRTEHIW